MPLYGMETVGRCDEEETRRGDGPCEAGSASGLALWDKTSGGLGSW